MKQKLLCSLVVMVLSLSLHAQSLAVYLEDHSKTATNIRNAPKGKVVDRIPQGRIAMFEVENAKNGWWRICDNSYFCVDNNGFEGMIKLKGSRNGYWIHSSVISVSTRNYGDETLYLYQQPDENSKKVFTIYVEMQLRPLEVQGDWVKCRTYTGNNVGWIQAEWLCGNALTNCN